jgi:hypothetical protein
LNLTNPLASRDDVTAAALATRFSNAEGGARAFAFAVLIVLARERGATTEAERYLREAASVFGLPGPLVESLVRALKSPAAFGEAAQAIEAAAAKSTTLDATGLYAVIGDYRRFFDALDARVAQRDTARFPRWMPFAWRVSPAGGDESRRFKTLVQSMGLVDYWKKHGWPDRCRPKGEDDFECS